MMGNKFRCCAVYRKSSLFGSSLNDDTEIFSLKGSAADKSAININLGNEFIGILSVHRATVLNGNGLGNLFAVNLCDSLANIAVTLISLVSGSGNACADSPNGCVSYDNVLKLVGSYVCKSHFCLIL